MARLDNGLIDLSLPISNIEVALHDYVYHPRRGLEKLKSALLSLQETSLSNITNRLYYLRLSSFTAAVDELLLSGSPYFSHYRSALLSSADALCQVAMAGQFSNDRSQQLDKLLSVDRSCWALVISIANEKDSSLVYRNYEARLDSTQSNVLRVDDYLEAFSSAGRVSFQLDSVKGSRINGRFILISVQSLSWLKRRFPSLQWQMLSINEKEPLRVLCELSFLPLFQNVTMSRDSRYRLLALFEDRFKTLFYQVFSSLFPLSLNHVDQVGRLVPSVNNVTTFEQDEQLAYFPVRHGGYVYISGRTLEASTETSYVKCLGRDYLSYFLYEIDTSFGRFVFDQQECLGRYEVESGDLFVERESFWFEPKAGVRAEVVLNMPLLSPQYTVCCPLLETINQVLVVKQGELYFALPYLFVREVEAVCSVVSARGAWVKNIWLTQAGAPLLEPWLLGKNEIFQFCIWPEKNKSTHPSRNGYYFGKVYGRMFWIEADLILALLPYKAPFSVGRMEDDELRSMPFFIHDGRCFDRVMSEGLLSEESSSSVDKMSFSVILEWMSEAVVLPFASCEWSATLNASHCVREFSLPSDIMMNGDENMKSQLADTQEGDFVINKKNYLSFVAGFWPTSSLLESDY
ncbi:hypothetical protein KDW99_15580 [Marinomonas rhizomae]|uniref:hypothetical protein n=1 Tax=Marinomonas rhizomae TaxID=491948 RepID=UPI002103027B|nr:hypothetical protein [Marinomonas rhizomae]UTV98663.1 hypothetical protein KDW99_15580 [Marinomonas rhizomae]